MSMISAIILGFVQGVTEFLPISSTGHLILTHAILGIENENALAFDALLHLATASAVVVYYFGEITVLVQALLRKLGRLPVNEKDFMIVKAIGAATIPAVVFGMLLESYMESAFRNPLIVALVLVLGSIFFMYAEYRYQSGVGVRDMDTAMGLKIGFFQSLALVPGVSRSGASIAGGMLLGLTRAEAARFAFLIAVPVLVGAGGKKLIELISSDITVEWMPVVMGSLTAFIVGLFAIHFMISIVRKYTLWPFIWYRVILAGFIIFVAFS